MTSPARERILDAAYNLFCARGVQRVGVDELISTANVAKATFYRHFASKDELVLAFLERREEIFTEGYLHAEMARRGGGPEDQLMAVFDIFDDWFNQHDFEPCSYIRLLLDIGPDHPLGRASVAYLEKVRLSIRELGEAAGLVDPEDFSHSFTILLKGSIVAAVGTDTQAAQRARRMGARLIEAHRP